MGQFGRTRSASGASKYAPWPIWLDLTEMLAPCIAQRQFSIHCRTFTPRVWRVHLVASIDLAGCAPDQVRCDYHQHCLRHSLCSPLESTREYEGVGVLEIGRFQRVCRMRAGLCAHRYLDAVVPFLRIGSEVLEQIGRFLFVAEPPEEHLGARHNIARSVDEGSDLLRRPDNTRALHFR